MILLQALDDIVCHKEEFLLEMCIRDRYKTLLTRYNIKPENAIFFDDRPENVEVAKMLGTQGVVFTPEVAEEYLG